MAKRAAAYPNITWPQFAVCNDNPRSAFEDMTRRLFYFEYLKELELPHSDHANPGIEVLPVLEPSHTDGSPQKRISFQSKYFEQSSADYAQIQKSARQAVKHYKGDLDVIYLFCNKTLTTSSNGYKSAMNILSDAGIELRPISNREVLDLVAKYPEISNYFFRPRTVADSVQVNTSYTGIKIDSITGAITILPEAFQQPSIDVQLLKELVVEKVCLCRTYILDLELEALKVELDKLLIHNIDNIDGAETLYYYKFLSNLRSGENIQDCFDKSGTQYYEEATWLLEFYKNPTGLRVEEFSKRIPETQIFVVDKLFTSQHWNQLVILHGAVKDNINPNICTQFELHYGLSLLNLHEYNNASIILRTLYEKVDTPRMRFYSIFADIQKINGCYRNGSNGDKVGLIELLRQMDDFKNTKQYQQNELIIAASKMESSYHLGLSDKMYLECAIKDYESYSENIRSNTVVKYYFGLCLELNGNKDAAISVYASLGWNTDETIAARYMIALILNGNPDVVLKIYEELTSSARSSRTDAIFLLALYNNGDDSYKETLIKMTQIHGKTLEDFLPIAYYVQDQSIAQAIITPVMRNLMTDVAQSAFQLYQKIELITFFAHCGEIGLLEVVLESISDLTQINNFAIGEIYNIFFNIANSE